LADPGRKVEAVLADVLICFQTAPGIDNSTIINPGPGTLVGSTTAAVPLKHGYYGFKMAENSSVDFLLLNSTYRIIHHKAAEMETATEKGIIPIHVWSDLGGFASVDRIQRQLQLLGYYVGKVDGVFGEKTERAILNFQADQGLRTDGKFNGAFLLKLDDLVEKQNKTSGIYIARRTLIRFSRAPSNDPEVSSSRPWGKAPDLDDRGYVKVPAISSSRCGPVVTMSENQNFRLKVIRENISDSAVLMINNSDPSKLDAQDLVLPNQSKVILDLESKTSGDSIIDVFYRGAGLAKIGSLQATILSLIKLQVQPYWVTISGVAPQGNKDDWIKIFDIANNIWWPYGIYFHFNPIIDKTVSLSIPGQISEIGGDLWTEFNKAINEKPACKKNAINLLLVNKIQDAIGITYSTASGNWPNGIALSMNPSGINASGNDLAHELGHSLSLSNLNSPSNKPAHADDDPDDQHKKEDIWTLRKLMYSYNSYDPTRSSDRWAQDVGYGKNLRGSMVTIRHLNNDLTDDECSKARIWASSPKRVYSK
jgi:hypothetical protein